MTQKLLRPVSYTHLDVYKRQFLSFVRIGTLDNPDECPPNAIIYTNTKQKWVCYPDNIPQFEEYYDMKALYPAESWARRSALKPKIDEWRSKQG